MMNAQEVRDEMFKSIIDQIDNYIKNGARSLHTKTSPITLSRDKAINEKVVNHLLSLNFIVDYYNNHTNVIVVSW